MTDQNWLVTKEMEEGLRRLQNVQPFDYASAHREAFAGIGALRPLRDRTAAAMIQGRCLAFELWHRRMTRTLELRKERRHV